MNQERRNKMIEDNLGLIPYCLQLLKVEYNEDYFQQGCLELIRCVDNYKESEGKKFSTYAVNNIKWYLKEYIQRDFVIKPKRIEPKTGKVDFIFCDSLDRTISQEGKQITLLEALPDNLSENQIKEIEEVLYQEKFFQYAKENFSLTEQDINLFKDFHFNGYTKKRDIVKKYNIPTKKINSKLEEIKSILQQAYLSYNKK